MKILVIGNTVNKNKKYITGQAMMIDVFISVISKKYKYKVCSLSPIFKPTKIGSASFIRYVEYVWLLIKASALILCNPKSFIYLSPAATSKGFKRDYFLFSLGCLMNDKFVFQQFTALFSDFHNGLSLKVKRKVEKMYNKASVIIVEGDFEKKQFDFVKDQDKIYCIPNGLPEQKEIETVNKKSYKGGSFNILFLSNMIESKGYWDVLEAVNIIINNCNKDINCNFIGQFYGAVDDSKFHSSEIAKEAFFKFIKEHGLQSHVKYQDCAFGHDKRILFENSHVLILPSYFIIEGQPTVILEALSYGCVPITTNYRLIPEMVNESNGIFVRPQNPQDIADAVCQLIDNPQKYEELSQNCLIDYKKKFTREIYEEHIINCIKNYAGEGIKR